MSITFNNPLKACFSNKKSILQSKHTRHKLYQIYFLMKNQFSADFERLLVYEINYLSL
jgi:hypothetical protein